MPTRRRLAPAFVKAGGGDRGGLVAFSLASGKVRWEVQEDAYVADLRVIRGRLVAAGLMRTVGAVRRANLATIDLPTGRIKDFDPNISGVTYNVYFTPYVSALAKRGRELYVGGSYGYVGGRAHPGLAAVDARTGRLRDTLPPAGGTVNALATARGPLYMRHGLRNKELAARFWQVVEELAAEGDQAVENAVRNGCGYA